jgi:hypothetical protein
MPRKLVVSKLIFDRFKIGEELIQEFVLYTNGAPLVKSHIPRVFAVLLERIWRVFNAQPGANVIKLFTTVIYEIS